MEMCESCLGKYSIPQSNKINNSWYIATSCQLLKSYPAKIVISLSVERKRNQAVVPLSILLGIEESGRFECSPIDINHTSAILAMAFARELY